MDKLDTKGWPMLLDMTKQECKQTLRALELTAYSKIVSVFRAQGELTKEKRKFLSELQQLFAISLDRHRAEIRRAVNDEILHTIAETLAGPNTEIEWSIEGRRLIPLMKRVPPQVSYTALATKMAQIYCGLNTTYPKPCDTAMPNKLEDVGADYDLTDSEDETEGLRYISEDMIPRDINPSQGSYTTLPLSQARVAKESLKRKLSGEKEYLEAPPSPTHIEEKRRKRSPSPPPPATIIPGVTQASALLNFHPLRQVILVSTTAPGAPVYQRSINVPILKSSSQVLTGDSNYGQASVVQQGGILKGIGTPIASNILAGGSSLVSKIRPRFSSMTSSILSQGSSSLPGLPPRPPRQRSNSLILHPDVGAGPHSSFPSVKKEGMLPRATSGPTILPDSSSGGPLNFLGSSNLQHIRTATSTMGAPKSAIQVKPPEINKVTGSVVAAGVLGNRIVGRPSPSPQGVYVMSTNSGTITVVTRTVASAGSLASPRVVTVSNQRSSIMRAPSPVSVIGKPPIPIRAPPGVQLPVGMRPSTAFIGGPKSNVIVVHKGPNPTLARPILGNIHGIRPRELSTKIFTKPLSTNITNMPAIVSSAVPAGSGKVPGGLLTGTLVVKPSGNGKTVAITSNKELQQQQQSYAESSSHITELANIGATNLVVLDFQHGGPPVNLTATPVTLQSEPEVCTIQKSRDVKKLISIEDFKRDLSSVSQQHKSTISSSNLLTEVHETTFEIISARSEEKTTPALSNVEEGDSAPKSPVLFRHKRTSFNETDEDNEWLKLGLEGESDSIDEKEMNDNQEGPPVSFLEKFVIAIERRAKSEQNESKETVSEDSRGTLCTKNDDHTNSLNDTGKTVASENSLRDEPNLKDPVDNKEVSLPVSRTKAESPNENQDKSEEKSVS